MESTLELIHNLQTWQNICIFIVVALGVLFVIAFALACRCMSRKRTRRSEGLSAFFTALATVFLVLCLIPSTGAVILHFQSIVAEQRWAYEALASVEEERGLRLGGQTREDEKAHLIEQMRSGRDINSALEKLEEKASSSD